MHSITRKLYLLRSRVLPTPLFLEPSPPLCICWLLFPLYSNCSSTAASTGVFVLGSEEGGGGRSVKTYGKYYVVYLVHFEGKILVLFMYFITISILYVRRIPKIHTDSIGRCLLIQFPPSYLWTPL